MSKALYLLVCLFVFNVYAQGRDCPSYAFSKREKREIRKEKKSQKKKQVLAQKHAHWTPCIVMAGKDTFYVRVKPMDEYSRSTKSFWIAFPDEGERKLSAGDIAQLWVCNPRDTVKYLSVNSLNEQGGNVSRLYKLIIDGKCKLLYDEDIKVAATVPIIWKSYQLYYKGNMWEVRIEAENTFIPSSTPQFKKSCKEAFAECPQIIYRIETGQYKSENIKDIVREFNDCLNNK